MKSPPLSLFPYYLRQLLLHGMSRYSEWGDGRELAPLCAPLKSQRQQHVVWDGYDLIAFGRNQDDRVETVSFEEIFDTGASLWYAPQGPIWDERYARCCAWLLGDAGGNYSIDTTSQKSKDFRVFTLWSYRAGEVPRTQSWYATGSPINANAAAGDFREHLRYGPYVALLLGVYETSSYKAKRG